MSRAEPAATPGEQRMTELKPGDLVKVRGFTSRWGQLVRLRRDYGVEGADIMRGAYTSWYPLHQLEPLR
jgi:hypothetical protein